MIFGPSGAGVLRPVFLGRAVGLVVPLRLAALPLLEEVCYAFVAGVWEAELLVARARAGYIVLAKMMKLISIVLNSLSTPLFLPCYSFVGVLSPLLMFLKGIKSKGFTQIRWDALSGIGMLFVVMVPCGPISSLHPWMIGSFVFLNDFTGQVVVSRREARVRKWD